MGKSFAEAMAGVVLGLRLWLLAQILAMQKRNWGCSAIAKLKLSD
jgi:hypothetical protein